jgi:hypothetical protein
LRKQILNEKAMESTKKKEEKGGKPKPEEQEGMPQPQHCPLAGHHEDKNPKFTVTSNRKTLHQFSPHIPQNPKHGIKKAELIE